jgi:hypothetical protein
VAVSPWIEVDLCHFQSSLKSDLTTFYGPNALYEGSKLLLQRTKVKGLNVFSKVAGAAATTVTRLSIEGVCYTLHLLLIEFLTSLLYSTIFGPFTIQCLEHPG